MKSTDSALGRLQQVEHVLGPCVAITLTATMMRKGIIDAIEPFRALLSSSGIHDYGSQHQGEAHKILLRTELLLDGERTQISSTSLYRPPTKQGDPRFWIYKLGQMCQAGDQLAVTVGREGQLLAVLLSASDWTGVLRTLESKFAAKARRVAASTENPNLTDLVERLKVLAIAPPLRSLVDADTGVGRTLEDALGIAMNSSKEPDYRGIELKFTRHRPPAERTRSTLFGQVPDWTISPCGSSRQILDRFGYDRDGVLKLYVEIGHRPNAQGLAIRHNPAAATIEETSLSEDVPVVARWELKVLECRLREKHNETAWVQIESTTLGGVEHFRPLRLLYTSAPRVDVFPLLIGTGLVTLDHLIKKVANRVTEKGPLWKLDPDGHSTLFAGTRVIELTA